VAQKLGKNEEKIISELNGDQGHPVDIGGYYRPDPGNVARAMRPSATFNDIVDSI
jgi:isocitrate dehydrogenase